MKAWLFSVFVMTPFAALQTGLAAFFGYSIYSVVSREEIGGGIFLAILSLALLLGVNKLVRLIRFGGGTWFGYNILYLIVSPLQLPLMLIVNLIAFIAIFTGWDIDARDEPYLDDYGFFGCVALYLFHIVPDYKTKKSKAFSGGYTGGSDRSYKWKTVAYQFAVLLLTVVHSPLLLILLMNVVENHNDGSDGGVWIGVLALIGAIIVYFVTVQWSAHFKGVKTHFDYWDPNDVKRHTYNKWEVRQALGLDRDPTEQEALQAIADGIYKPVKTKQVNTAGWKTAFTLPMIIYLICGMVIVFNQFFVFLLSIIISAKATVRPCIAKDARLRSFGAKLRYFLFGTAEL